MIFSRMHGGGPPLVRQYSLPYMMLQNGKSVGNRPPGGGPREERSAVIGGLVHVRTVLISSVLALALLAVGCAGGQTGGSQGGGGGGGGGAEVRPALVLDVGGLGDQSFNDSAFAGLQRAKKEFNVETETLESSSPTDYVDNLTQFADSGYNPVFAVGFLMTDAVNEIAPQYPDTNFAIVDSVVEPKNAASLVF